MSENALAAAQKPKSRIRPVLYATALLVGGGVIGAIVVGPTLGQPGPGPGPSAQDQGPQGPGGDGPRWRRGWDGDQQGGPRWGGRDGDRDGGSRWGRGQDGGREAREGDGQGWRERLRERWGRSGGEGHHMRGGDFAGRMMYPGAIERRVNRVLGAVDASTEQRQKVRAVFEAAANDLSAMRQKRMDNRKQMVEALSAATIDRPKLESIRADRMKLADDTSKRMTAAMADAAEVLTPAQRADLAARFQRRGG